MNDNLDANLDLWNHVRKVDPKHTKEISGKGYKGTSTNFTYLAQLATEQFGPCGIGWGWVITGERIERLTDTILLHIANVTVWYEYDGKRGEVPHIGQTFLVSKNGHADEDAPKKSVTDAITKALACMGFAADIHMGRYDDNKYVQAVNAEFREKEREASPKPELSDSDQMMLRGIADCQTKEALDRWALNHGEASQSSDNAKIIRKAWADRAKEITPEQQKAA
ncbi:hypothetical protein ACSMXM_05680 [Pacificimonas sp. ICDLI1SI03]